MVLIFNGCSGKRPPAAAPASEEEERRRPPARRQRERSDTVSTGSIGEDRGTSTSATEGGRRSKESEERFGLAPLPRPKTGRPSKRAAGVRSPPDDESVTVGKKGEKKESWPRALGRSVKDGIVGFGKGVGNVFKAGWNGLLHLSVWAGTGGAVPLRAPAATDSPSPASSPAGQPPLSPRLPGPLRPPTAVTGLVRTPGGWHPLPPPLGSPVDTTVGSAPPSPSGAAASTVVAPRAATALPQGSPRVAAVASTVPTLRGGQGGALPGQALVGAPGPMQPPPPPPPPLLIWPIQVPATFAGADSPGAPGNPAGTAAATLRTIGDGRAPPSLVRSISAGAGSSLSAHAGGLLISSAGWSSSDTGSVGADQRRGARSASLGPHWSSSDSGSRTAEDSAARSDSAPTGASQPPSGVAAPSPVAAPPQRRFGGLSGTPSCSRKGYRGRCRRWFRF